MSQRICVFGDSIPWGAEDQDRGGWADRLKAFIKKTGKFNEVFNLANPGKDTNYLVEFMENDCLARLNPEKRASNMIIIQVGINDSQYVKSEDRQRIDLGTTQENIKKIIKIAGKFVDKIVFVGLTFVDEKKSCPLRWSDDKFQKLENAKNYNEAIKTVCQKNKVAFLDVLDLLNENDLHDGVHPNEKGHEKLFETVKDFLLKKKFIEFD